MRYKKKHIIAMILSFIIVLIIFLLAFLYRPYIYEKGIYSFYFADTFSNWLAVPAASLFSWGLEKGKDKFEKIVIFEVVFFVIYEFTLSGTIDRNDTVATILSGAITISVYLLYKKYRLKAISQE